jgi:hypothetical protein
VEFVFSVAREKTSSDKGAPVRGSNPTAIPEPKYRKQKKKKRVKEESQRRSK